MREGMREGGDDFDTAKRGKCADQFYIEQEGREIKIIMTDYLRRG